MEQIKVYYDEFGQTLTIWFDDPDKEVIAEEVGSDVVMMKSEDGRALGFEILNMKYQNPEKLEVLFERFNEVA